MANERIYIADKSTLDKVRSNTDFIISQLMTLNNDETLKTKVAANYFNTCRTGKVFGVSFHDYGISTSPLGTRMYDAVDMIARPSTDKIADRNDFDNYAIFNGLTVNGRVESTGEFVVTYFEGEDGFSNTENDTYILFGTSYVKIAIDAQGETISVTDKPKEGFFPMGGAVRPDKSIRPFIPMAKYLASDGKDSSPASVSGKIPYHNNASESWCVTKFHTKGTQYCAATMQDRFMIETLFQVVFATRHSQSIMAGCTSYNFQYPVAKAESNVNRVIVTTAQAADFVVGSSVSVGTPANTDYDRNGAQMHNVADRVLITDIKEVSIDGSQYGAIYISGDAITTVEGTYVSTMPWYTGACDNVLGTCGSPGDNLNGKYPFIFFGIEMMNGQWEVIGNAIYQQTNGDALVGKMHVCYDAAKVAATVTADYVEVGYPIAMTSPQWGYVSKLGFDLENPCMRTGSAIGASTTTGYCDGQYTSNSAGIFEVLRDGNLNFGADAGLIACCGLNGGVGYSTWSVSARLSATGKSGVVTAA